MRGREAFAADPALASRLPRTNGVGPPGRDGGAAVASKRRNSVGHTGLGGDIFFHGGALSIGCLAMGDPAIEELFELCADTGIENVEVLLAPNDLQSNSLGPPPPDPSWVADLYADLARRLSSLPPKPGVSRANLESRLETEGSNPNG